MQAEMRKREVIEFRQPQVLLDYTVPLVEVNICYFDIYVKSNRQGRGLRTWHVHKG